MEAAKEPQKMVAPPHSSPKDDRDRELNAQIKRLADVANKPWHSTATGWFACCAALAAIIAAVASLMDVMK